MVKHAAAFIVTVTGNTVFVPMSLAKSAMTNAKTVLRLSCCCHFFIGSVLKITEQHEFRLCLLMGGWKKAYCQFCGLAVKRYTSCSFVVFLRK